jgi:hypothetical protein
MFWDIPDYYLFCCMIPAVLVGIALLFSYLFYFTIIAYSVLKVVGQMKKAYKILI